MASHPVATRTPASRFPEITLRAAALVPPTVMSFAPAVTWTPWSWLGSATRPLARVPMKLPCTIASELLNIHTP